ncbi:MAG TPA: hypothetical protein VNF24_09815 [Candidatus Acidoferrales bacterium]|nr:hypothetical protein [Candidatus Acidoferrales bacterium]
MRREGRYRSLLSQGRQQRDRGAITALTQRVGRPGENPRDRELARLRKEKARLVQELDRARRVMESRGKLAALLEGLAPESAAEKSEPTS